MKYDDFKNSIDSVKPDAHLQTRLKASVEESSGKSTQKIKKPVLLGLVSVMALAVVVTGLGAKDLISNDKVVTSGQTASVSTQSKVAPGFVDIVYANDKKTYAMDVSNISVDSPPYCQIGAWSIKGKSEDEIEDMFNQIHEDFKLVEGFVGEEEVYFSTSLHTERMDNTIIYSAYCGAFDFDLSENDYANVKEIRVTNSNQKLGEMEIVAEDALFDENLKRKCGNVQANETQNTYITNRNKKYASLSGDRFRRCMKLEKDGNGRFRINWKMSDAFYELLDENPDTDFTKIKDTLTFEVVFNDDSVSKSVVNVSFDKNGNMKTVPSSFQYIEK